MRKCLKYLNSFNLMFFTDLLMSNVCARGDSNIDHDFGQLYKWRTLFDGLIEAKKNRQPLMIIIHKPWCPACKQLKPKFAKSIKLIDMSKHFVMVNVENSTDDPMNEEKFHPDGKYVPRILFFTPDGELISEVYNRHPGNNPDYKYFYGTPAQIVESMTVVLQMFPPRSPVFGMKSSSSNVRYEKTNISNDDYSTPTIDKPTVLE